MKELIFRASSVGHLMTDARGVTLTDKQAATLAELRAKPNLTDKQGKELERLTAISNAKEELSVGAKSYTRRVWREQQYNYYLPVNTNVLTSGRMSEQRCLALLDTVVPSLDFRSNNKERKKDEYFTGEIDVLLKTEKIIEDVKASYTLETYHEVEKPSLLYYAQAQVYMRLWNVGVFRLHYCLVPTPEWVIENEIRRNSYLHPGGCDDPQHLIDAERIRSAHLLPEKLDPCDCVTTFIIHRNDQFMKKLIHRVGMAREYASTLSLRREPKIFNINV